LDTSANNGPVNIGQVLNQARIRRRLSVDQVSDALHIRREYLLALEQNRWDDLPGEVYAQGFLKNYARYVDLNPEAMVEERRRQIGQPVDRPPVPPLEPLSRTGLYTQTVDRSSGSSQPPHKRAARREKAEAPDYSSPSSLIWLLGALLVLFVGGLFLLAHSSHPSSAPRHPLAAGQAKKAPSKNVGSDGSRATKTKTRSHVPSTSTVATNPVNVQLQTTSQSGKLFYANYLVNRTPVKVTLNFSAACWVDTVINGVTQPGKMYYGGQKVSFTGSKSVDVILGSHAVAVHVDGRQVSLPSPSYVLDMTFQG
jgi:cytoskeletal protein RodZ